LSYDLYGHASSCNDEIETSEAIASILGADSVIMNVDEKMSTECFVEWYGCHNDKKLGDSHSRKKLATIMKATVIKDLRHVKTGK